jgi:HK97 family phage prohead protease
MLRQADALRVVIAPIRDVQVRDAQGTGDGSWTIEGYAAVYEQETTLWDIPGWWRVREEIARGAFTSVLERLAHGEELVHLNHGHDMKTAMAATNVKGIGGLELAEDFHGLRFFARVDPEDPDARALAVKMGRGVIQQSSFAFTIDDESLVESEVLDDETLDQKWRIEEIGHLYDVCVCAQGAYAQTESYIRSLAAASLRVPDFGTPGRADPAGRNGRGEGPGRAPVAPETAGGDEWARAHDRQKAETHAANQRRQRSLNR